MVPYFNCMHLLTWDILGLFREGKVTYILFRSLMFFIYYELSAINQQNDGTRIRYLQQMVQNLLDLLQRGIAASSITQKVLIIEAYFYDGKIKVHPSSHEAAIFSFDVKFFHITNVYKSHIFVSGFASKVQHILLHQIK